MRINWKGFIVAFVVILTVLAFGVTDSYAARGVAQRPGGMHGGPPGGGHVGGGQFAGGGQHPGGFIGGGQGGGFQPGQRPGQGIKPGGQFPGGSPGGRPGGFQPGLPGQGIKPGGQFPGGRPGIIGRPGGFPGGYFDRNRFFGGRGYDWWAHNQRHYYWSGNQWVYGVVPVGFIPVPVPVSACPYTPGMYGGNPDACFYSCVSAGYDPNACNFCCGTNY